MNKKRGLSSVIGMIFLVIVLSSTIGYFTYGVNLIEQLNDELILKGIEMQDKTKEDFEVLNARIDAGKFNLTVQNTGQLPINFTRIWVNNVTDSSWQLQNFTVNKIASPNHVLNNLGQNINLTALESQSYSLRLVTERGNTFNVQLSSPQSESLEMNLFSAPRSVLTNQDVTVWYGVTNNRTDGSILQLITPEIEDPPDATGGAWATYQEGPIPTTKGSLAPGDTAFFKWIYRITGNSGETVTFNATVNNAKQGNYVTESIEVTTLSPSSVQIENAGVIQMDYETLEWAQGSLDWQTGWHLVPNEPTVWRMNITNNDLSDTLYLGDHSALVQLPVESASKRAYYIVENATTNPLGITQYNNLDQSIGPGEKVRIYFAATTDSGDAIQSTPSQTGINESPILIFGIMCPPGSCPGSGVPYGQTIPFLGILID